MPFIIPGNNPDKLTDEEYLYNLAFLIAEYWNENSGRNNGFSLRVSENAIRKCCEVGRKVMERHFPDASPFKRVAGVLVLGRFCPFLGLTSLDAPDGEFLAWDATDSEQSVWGSRVLSLIIAQMLADQTVEVGKPGMEKPVTLDKWQMFPTEHIQIEFIELLDWFGRNGGIDDQPTDSDMSRLARMIYSIGLILEAYYYLNEVEAIGTNPDGVRGQCVEDPNNKSLSFLVDLQAYARAEAERTRGERGAE